MHVDAHGLARGNLPSEQREREGLFRLCLWRATKSPFKINPASKASVEGEAPSGFAGGGGDASPFK